MNSRSCIAAIVGALLAWLLWTQTTVAFMGTTVTRAPAIPGTLAPLNYSLWAVLDYKPLLQSGIIRIVTGGNCIYSLSVNGVPLAAAQQHIVRTSCHRSSITLDLTPYFKNGRNVLQIRAADRRKLDSITLRGLHDTTTLLSIVACLLFHPLSRLILHAVNTPQAVRQWPARYRRHALVALLLIPAVALKWQGMSFASGDFIGFLDPWLKHIQFHGLGRAYQFSFTNYAPLYTYILGIADLFFPLAPNLHIAKYATFAGEAFAAFWAFRIVALRYDARRSIMPILAAMTLLLTPSVLVNGAVIAQCDIWYTAFLLAASYYFLARRPVTGLFYAGLAYAFKQQALFLSPILLILTLRGIVRWKWLWVVPGVYLLTCLPGWLQGRPLQDMLMVYWHQAANHPNNLNAANYYWYLGAFDALAVRMYGLLAALVIALFLVRLTWERWHDVSPASFMLLATLFAAVMPFSLPMMHDRYFFVADIFSLVLAFLQPRWFRLTVLLQASSLLVQPPYQAPMLYDWFGALHHDNMQYAIWFNTAAIALLLWLCWQYIWKASPRPAHA